MNKRITYTGLSYIYERIYVNQSLMITQSLPLLYHTYIYRLKCHSKQVYNCQTRQQYIM